MHKTLELEIAPEAVPVKITTNEERWALRYVVLPHIALVPSMNNLSRIINMLASLQMLAEQGICVRLLSLLPRTSAYIFHVSARWLYLALCMTSL